MKIHEAAELALKELGRPAHQVELRKYIESMGYYTFGARESAAVVGVELSRRSDNVHISRALPEKLFYRASPATYGLIAWRKRPIESPVDNDIAEILSGHTGPTTKRQLVLARIGQGVFREAVLSLWNSRCAVTGTTFAVRASHIVPWRECNDAERLDPNNGLPLVATLDALFDSCLISFDIGGKIIFSIRLPEHERTRLRITSDMRLRDKPATETERYLQSHRERLKA